MANYKPKDFIQVAELIGEYFERAERDIVAMIAKNADKHMSQAQDQWLRSQQASIIANRKAIEKIVEQYKTEGAKVLNRLPVRMYLAGVMSADADLSSLGLMEGVDVVTEETAVQYTDGVSLTGSFGIVHAGAVNALASAYSEVVSGALLQITRKANDIYKKIIADATSSALLGSKTRVQATQDAINKFIKNGVGGFQDKRGRWWSLEAYTQMATRTLITQALNQGKVNRYTEMNNDLVIVSRHTRSCELCRPWQRKVLSLSGKTQGYPTFDQAKGSGLFHPNCGHTFTAYVEGLTNMRDEDLNDDYNKADAEAYANQQKLRAMERRMRQLKMQEAKAVSPEQKAKIEAKIKAHSAKINQFCKDTGIPRKRSNERKPATDLIKTAGKVSTTGGKGNTTGGAKKPKKTQNSGANSKGQGEGKEEPKKAMSPAEIQRQKNLENFKRLKAEAEARKKAEEEARKKKEAEQFDFDIDRFVDPNLPSGLQKLTTTARTRVPGRGIIEGQQFCESRDYSNPLHGVVTADKIKNDISTRYRTKDPTHLANAYQYYLTGHHLATPHKFAYTAEEWAKVCTHADPTRIAGFNRGGFEIWYGNMRSSYIKKIMDGQKFSCTSDDVQALYSMNTFLHEQIHSIRHNHTAFNIYRADNHKMGTTIEEGMTQYLSLNLLDNFLTFGGFLDTDWDRSVFNDAYKEFIKRSSYEKETGHIGLMAYAIGKKAGLTEKEVVSAFINAKEHVTMSPNGLAKAFSGLLGIKEDKLEQIFTDYFSSFMNAVGDVGDPYDVRDFAEAIGADEQTCNTLFLAMSNASENPYKAYLQIKNQAWK